MPTRDDETDRDPSAASAPSDAADPLDAEATQATLRPVGRPLDVGPAEPPPVRVRVRPAPVPPPPRTGPDRRTLAVFGGLALAGLAIGAGAAVLTGGDDPEVRAARPVATTPSPTPSATPSATPTPTPTPSRTPKPSPTRSIPPDYTPIPADAVEHAKDLDFGYLTAVRKNGDLVSLTFDRASIVTVKGGGFRVDNTNPAVRTFQVLPKASLVGMQRLLPAGLPPGRRAVTVADLMTTANAALANGQGIAVWLRHTGDENGPVTSLSEQYLP